MLTVLLGLTLAAPDVAQAFQRAPLAPCHALAPHPDDPLHVTLVVSAEGGWTVGPGPFEEPPPKALEDCITDVVREALEGVPLPRRAQFFERTLWPQVSLRERFEAKRGEVEVCVLARLPAVDHLVTRLQLSITTSGVLRVDARGPTAITTCVKQHLVGLSAVAEVADVELVIERPGAPPRHDGTPGAVCRWGSLSRERTPSLPNASRCRRGLVCGGCSGGAFSRDQGEPDLFCRKEGEPCPPVP